MTIGIIYLFESVQIKQHHGHRIVVFFCHLDCLIQIPPEKLAVIHISKRVMVDVIFKFCILDLQLFFRILKFLRQTLNLKMRAQNISVLKEYQHTQYRTQYDQQNRGRRVNIVQSLNFKVGVIDRVNIFI